MANVMYSCTHQPYLHYELVATACAKGLGASSCCMDPVGFYEQLYGVLHKFYVDITFLSLIVGMIHLFL